jgi:hypothetical protein
MKSQDRSLSNFSWQNGYGAFSVNEKNVETVSRYIDRQEEHHGPDRVVYQDEFLSILRENEIDFDPKYIWD